MRNKTKVGLDVAAPIGLDRTASDMKVDAPAVGKSRRSDSGSGAAGLRKFEKSKEGLSRPRGEKIVMQTIDSPVFRPDASDTDLPGTHTPPPQYESPSGRVRAESESPPAYAAVDDRPIGQSMPIAEIHQARLDPLSMPLEGVGRSMPTLTLPHHTPLLERARSLLGQPAQKPMPAPQSLVEHDLLAGVELEHLPATFTTVEGKTVDLIPKLKAHVTFTPQPLKDFGGSRLDRLENRLSADVKVGLNAASKEIRKEIHALDQKFAHRKPTTNDLVELRKTLGNIVGAQQAKAAQFVGNSLDMELYRDEARHASNVRFVGMMMFKLTKAGVSAASIAVLPNPLSMAALIYGSLQMAVLVREHAKGRDQALAELEAHDAKLSMHFSPDHPKKQSAFVAHARAALASTHIPGTHELAGPTLATHKKALREFLAKSQSLHSEIRKLDRNAQPCALELEAARHKLSQLDESGQSTDAGKAARAQVQALAEKVESFRGQIEGLEKLAVADNKTYLHYARRLEDHEQNKPVGVDTVAIGTGATALSTDLAYAGFATAKIALELLAGAG